LDPSIEEDSTMRINGGGVLVLALGVALGWGRGAGAEVIYDGFGDTTGLTINGDAFTTSTGDGTVLRLTRAAGVQAGSAFSTAKVSTAEFYSVFSFRITGNGGAIFDNNTENGADGIAFVVQNQANNVGGAGQGIGYAGITPSLVIEYDTWGNSFNNDPSQSHVGIMINGRVDHNAPNQGPVVNIGDTNAGTTAMPGPELDDGHRWWSWVRYDGWNLSVYLERNDSVFEPLLPSAPILTLQGDLSALLGGSEAFAGFTSATGAAWSNHDILYWRYNEAFGGGVIPEPSSMAMALTAGAGLALGLGHRRARRRGRLPGGQGD
jgi:hypothetical protein